MLILDDLQWADTSTALLLAHLLGTSSPRGCSCWARSARPTATAAAELTDLLAPALPRARFERIALEGLDGAETHALVARYADDVSGSFVLRLQEGTDGNPFFIKETLRSLADAERRSSARWRACGAGGVKELIGTRLARLGETANHS